MSVASDVYNQLPYTIRSEAQGALIEGQITMLLIEKARLKEAYKGHMAQIDSHLNNCKKSLECWEKEISTPKGGV